MTSAETVQSFIADGIIDMHSQFEELSAVQQSFSKDNDNDEMETDEANDDDEAYDTEDLLSATPSRDFNAMAM